MATTIDWANKIIYPDRADMVQVQSSPIEIYQLDVNDTHLALRDLEDNEQGITYDTTHTYKAPTTLSGVTYARLMEIINDYTYTFLPDSSWVVQIVGGNSNIGDRVNPNNVSVQVANSAGLQDAESLQAASFLGHVAIDIVNGISGTTFPRGTDETPVDNLTDAKAIAEDRGLREFRIVNSMTIDTGTDLSDGYTFYTDRVGVVATIDAAADVTNCTFKDISVTGTLDANNQFIRCLVFDATSLQAQLTDCGLSGTMTLGGGGLTQLINCHSNVAGGGIGQYPTVDMGGSGNDLLVRDYSGGLAVSNVTVAGSDVSMDFDSGRLVIDSSVAAGTITVRGNTEITDNSTGTAVIEDDTLVPTVVNKVASHIWAAN